MRLFIAIDTPEEVHNYFLSIQKQINSYAKINFTKTFHLTLKFLGEVKEENVEKITTLLNEIKFDNFSIKLNKIGLFPNENYIKVVWVGLEPEEPILRLQKGIDNSLKSIFKEEKNFKPHLTLARVKLVKNKENFIKNLENIKIEQKQFDVSSFKLIKSILTPNGPIYEDVAEFPPKPL